MLKEKLNMPIHGDGYPLGMPVKIASTLMKEGKILKETIFISAIAIKPPALRNNMHKTTVNNEQGNPHHGTTYVQGFQITTSVYGIPAGTEIYCELVNVRPDIQLPDWLVQGWRSKEQPTTCGKSR